jgi:hypothetical protein
MSLSAQLLAGLRHRLAGSTGFVVVLSGTAGSHQPSTAVVVGKRRHLGTKTTTTPAEPRGHPVTTVIPTTNPVSRLSVRNAARSGPQPPCHPRTTSDPHAARIGTARACCRGGVHAGNGRRTPRSLTGRARIQRPPRRSPARSTACHQGRRAPDAFEDATYARGSRRGPVRRLSTAIASAPQRWAPASGLGGRAHSTWRTVHPRKGTRVPRPSLNPLA